ncbi:MAG TPA: phosphoribosylglycinamide formyltransferase [Methanospirillum sp.]|uniref:phosphoribosylglycinamide formyltransferase n=1 Tax=Methanospirillum sp. TaxID=45200 RepID=UPI002C9AC4D3|nr:phosphoribosylglycinamide formyltransferase [Methanospirillum sp.]HWQ63364.1 phosphoribosylglycinamide formyltransferase [Methanospirillum sp.]
MKAEKGTFVVLASGRGSNFQAILDKAAEGYIPAVCKALITDNPDAYAIERARAAGIPGEVVSFRSFSDKQTYETALIAAIQKYDPDLVVLAGYMRILGSEIVRKYSGRMVNIHPSLLPSFTGLHAQQQAVNYGVKVAGCTVHFVTEDMDAGPVIIQRTVPVFEGDDGDILADRILIEEHKAFPEAIRLFFERRLRIEGRVVKIGNAHSPSPGRDD